MHLLAIETSCDETGVTVVEYTKDADAYTVTVRGDALLSQAQKHAEFGGVYPSLAKREHAKNAVPLLIKALTDAGMRVPTRLPSLSQEKVGELKVLLEREPELFVQLMMFFAQTQKPEDLDAIAVTHGPGLAPALWVGVNFAKALALAWDLPLVPVNHLEGHIISAHAHKKSIDPLAYTVDAPPMPLLSLLISGGHTELVLSHEWLRYERLGSTRDDAVGEAFDKSARLLGLPYPGGPEISRLAQAAREENLPQPYSLPRPMIASGDFDFSCSGIKTAVRTLVQNIGEPDETQKKQIARELEDALTDVLIAKTQKALDAHGAQSLVISGGVSANTEIRRRFTLLAQEYSIPLFIPEPQLATDNARMISLAAVVHHALKHFTESDTLNADGNLKLY